MKLWPLIVLLSTLVVSQITAAEVGAGQGSDQEQSKSLAMFVDKSILNSDKVLVMVAEIEGCSYCDRVKQEFLIPLSLDPTWASRFQVARLDMNSADDVADFSGQIITQAQLADQLGSTFSPTLMFLHPVTGVRLSEDIIGLTTPEFYGYYLQNNIAQAYEKLTGSL